MTPRAATPAGRRASGPAKSSRKPASGSSPRAPREEIRITAKSPGVMAGAARAAVRASATAAAPRRVAGPVSRPGRAVAPRRVSGPLGGRGAAAAAAVALPQRAPVPLPTPRRRPVPVTRPSRGGRDLPGGARALGWLRGLPDHRVLDRLIGGRVWIVLIGTLLVGIVTMQLSLLKLNAGIGRAVERSSALEQRNATLRATISQLSDSQRVIAAATGMGYVVPPQGSPLYVHAAAGNAQKALSVMRVPLETSTTTATALASTTAGSAVTTSATDPAVTTTTDPTATTDTTTSVTTDPSTTAPVTSAPPTSTSGAAGTTATSVTTGSVAAGGATAPTG